MTVADYRLCTDPAEDGAPDIVSHEAVMRDKFAEIPSVKRYVPGDCFCAACGQPIAAWWNGGNPKPA